jgi:hypothetical protein
MTMTAGGAGYAGGPYRERVLLEIEHAGALRAGTRPRGAPAVTPGPFGRKIKDQPNGGRGDSRPQGEARGRQSRSALPPGLGVLQRDACQFDA